MDVKVFLHDLVDDRDYEGQVVHVQAIEPREAQYAQAATEIPADR